MNWHTFTGRDREQILQLLPLLEFSAWGYLQLKDSNKNDSFYHCTSEFAFFSQWKQQKEKSNLDLEQRTRAPTDLSNQTNTQ